MPTTFAATDRKGRDSIAESLRKRAARAEIADRVTREKPWREGLGDLARALGGQVKGARRG